ncbi:uncharacterized protein LOC114245427 [Bombyx mandarina]|uniref:CHK kinase-like domain-containing protein n=2 Tax=Bombyx TaxID=7090 RepID=A0A8R2QZU6_BOMMO|nr:uncharacterized protein LOC114245427 [Bombyx mandarina]XP_037870077.1 uncharacterized protein LOC119629158 [Bombyx mori]
MKPLSLDVISRYLTKNVIAEVFKLKTDSDEDIENIELTKAAPNGEGLLSAVYRIKVTGKRYSTSFIGKGFVDNERIKNSLNCAELFRREALFYSDVLPILVDLQQSLGASECIQNSVPICYGCYLDGVNDYIVLEDLGESRCKSLTKHPTKCERDSVLETLAHLHAVSMTLRIKKPDEFKRIADLIPEAYYTEKNRDWYSKFQHKAVMIDQAILIEHEDPSSVYYKKYNELLGQDVYGCLIEMTTTRGDFTVINHGDSWTPNFLRSKGRTVAIDFQMIRCASPVTDLMLFLFMCTNVCSNVEQFEEALDHYYNFLDYFLKDMGMDVAIVFPRDAFENELKIYGKFGFLTCLTSIPLLANEGTSALQLTEDFPEHSRIPLEKLWDISPIKNEQYQMRFVNALRLAVDANLI